MKRLLPLIVLVALSTSAMASEAWNFVYVSRSSDLGVTTGHGMLVRSSSRLSGSLVGEQDVQFFIDLSVTGQTASAVFGSLESDDGGTRMQGTYRQRTMPALGGTTCWQTVHLSDGFSSLALARNAPSCEP